MAASEGWVKVIFLVCVSVHTRRKGGTPIDFFFVNFAYGKLQSVQNSNKILLPLNFLKAKVGPVILWYTQQWLMFRGFI